MQAAESDMKGRLKHWGIMAPPVRKRVCLRRAGQRFSKTSSLPRFAVAIMSRFVSTRCHRASSERGANEPQPLNLQQDKRFRKESATAQKPLP